ncbi:hypothetical protein SELMODRAFT_412944 [Selaginella moellendorffii]|uniref:Myb-like domain-containing protein n=1 Tax=Selaginella moellendorffii TaxID=88036 RepID=D8RMU5_SELML|nr:trihelix transcription factor GT-3b [Selaginella moellendorffii]EFJ26592.1 hypothetical protein SELMODRAFT_412944 [Selaginella moellendorffii]|eukprot:XP_002972506.1 trihelix transcription factor GT-3b [Selaginella moellendorffii]
MADEMFLAMPLQSLVGGSSALENLSGGGRKGGKKDDRIPQWGFNETKELIAIRAELEKDFTQTKRNKTLWELIAGKMKDRGYRRSADQCKCKWKNLVNRYKGKELSDPENGRQCPFFDELDSIFKARLKNAGSKLLLESDGLIRPKKRTKQQQQQQPHLSDDPDNSDEEEEQEEEDPSGGEDDRAVQKKKRKADKERQRATAEKYRANNMQEVLEEFFQQQQRMEEQWREVFERRDRERRDREAEWRQRMERLEAERRAREHEWWEREEVRRAQDELRSQKREELLTALVMRVAQEP